jgi:hypothetical protein
MIWKLFMIEFFLMGSIAALQIRAAAAERRKKELLQRWLNDMMRDAHEHRVRVGEHISLVTQSHNE